MCSKRSWWLLTPCPARCPPSTRPPQAPKVIGVKLTGKLSAWASPKDVICKVRSGGGGWSGGGLVVGCVR